MGELTDAMTPPRKRRLHDYVYTGSPNKREFRSAVGSSARQQGNPQFPVTHINPKGTRHQTPEEPEPCEAVPLNLAAAHSRTHTASSPSCRGVQSSSVHRRHVEDSWLPQSAAQDSLKTTPGPDEAVRLMKDGDVAAKSSDGRFSQRPPALEPAVLDPLAYTGGAKTPDARSQSTQQELDAQPTSMRAELSRRLIAAQSPLASTAHGEQTAEEKVSVDAQRQPAEASQGPKAPLQVRLSAQLRSAVREGGQVGGTQRRCETSQATVGCASKTFLLLVYW
jgi:hypothetical protein